MADGFSELALLRAGQEPDYSSPGLPVAYAFRYLPKRVACILAALTRLGGRPLPRRVLDIGSGSGATAIAFSLLSPNQLIEIDAIEPSAAMRRFALHYPLHGNVLLNQWRGSLYDVTADSMALDPDAYDLVMMSACLPYDGRVIPSLSRWLRRVASSPAALIAIEPQAKSAQMAQLKGCLLDVGHSTVSQYCCHDLLAVLRSPLILDRTTELLGKYHGGVAVSAQLTAQGRNMLGSPHAVNTWNESNARTETVLVCRHPSPDSSAGGRRARRNAAGLMALLIAWLIEHW